MFESFYKNTIIIVLLFLSGCIVVPKTTYTKENITCDLKMKNVYLTTIDYGLDGIYCRGEEDCIALLAAVSLVSVGSVIVSGSIMVIGNTIYWIEKQGKCENSVIRSIVNELVELTSLEK